jgi:hypothetical protein
MCGSSSFAFLEHLAWICASERTRDPSWIAERTGRLPREIRDALALMCRSSPHAGHYFAARFDRSHMIEPHFEHLSCERNCLRRGYVSAGNHCELIRTCGGGGDQPSNVGSDVKRPRERWSTVLFRQPRE